MKKNVFINATATKTGGALSILSEFIDSIKLYTNEYEFYVFSSIKEKIPTHEGINIVDKSGIDNILKRIYWDLIGIIVWSYKKKIFADIVISFQNTGFNYFGNSKKYVYVHQAIPYYKKYSWSITDKSERKLWFYKNIYKKAMELTWGNRCNLIVQTNWMKEIISNDNNIDKSRIKVIRPKVKKIIKVDRNISNNFNIIYPASSVKYKNHIELIKAIELIKYRNNNIYKNINVFFTIDKECKNSIELIKYCEEKDIDNIKFIGYKDYKDLITYYEMVDLMVFPSLIETVGLPILEFKQLNKPIIVKDTIYARESLGQYVNSYIYKDVEDLSLNIEKVFNGLSLVNCFKQKFEYSEWSDIFK
ncbi:glycosyltransferase [Clostridium perfringens]|uniref:glycosyltransferase n=1 Tax=Clostridium perfringens TaxID=1502 RepID=UPI002AC5B1F0|nr:glycosyltransferase [Clostridium perfringens]MDZ4956699.1 glycosyltransferase [Clostridium perfringens]